MKTLYFTDQLSPDLTNLENVTLGIIGEQEYPQDEIKRVPALKLVKAMKQMTNKDDYVVMGDGKFVEAGKRLGFKTEEVEEPKEPEKELEPEGELTAIASGLVALDKKYRELATKYGNAQKLEEELKKKYETDLENERNIMKAKIKEIKQTIKKIIKE